MGRRLLLLVVVSAALALPFGAGASNGSWRTHSVASVGFSVETPATWVDITSAAPKVLDDLVRDEPSLGSLVRLVKSNKLIKLFCIARSGKANVNVIAAPIGSISLKAYVSSNIAQLEASPEVRGRIASTPVTLPAGAAYSVSYREVVGKNPATATLQYYLIHGRTSYVVTFTTSPSLAAGYRATFLRSARSIRLLPVS